MNLMQQPTVVEPPILDSPAVGALGPWPAVTLTASILLTAAFAAWACFTLYSFQAASTERMQHIRELVHLRGSIRYLDEVLTNSAKMAAESGDPAWEQRYRKHEPELDVAIKRAMAIAPQSTSMEAAQRIDAANHALVAMEDQAFAFVRAGQIERAQALLNSPAYVAHKLTYAEGAAALSESLTLAMMRLEQEQQRQVTTTTVIAVVLLGALLFGWLFSARSLRNWRRAALVATEDLRHQKQELALANKAERDARTLTQSELDQLFTSSLDLLTLGSLDGKIVRANPSFCAAFGYAAEDLVGQPFADIVPEEDRPALAKNMSRLAAGETLIDVVMRIKTKDGRVRHAQWNLVPFVEQGVFYATGRDITDRLKLEESLRTALAGMQDAQRIGMVGSWSVDIATGFSVWSDETFRICGLAQGEVTPHLDVFYSIIHPDDLQRVRHSVELPLARGEKRRLEYRFVLKDGSVRDIAAVMELLHAPDGSPLRLHGTCQDVTEQRDAKEKQGKLEDQLRASQKMEAVGSLAGGIAHDFNNLLSVILSYVGFVMDALPIGDTRRDDLMEVQKAADRAAGLTRQLLAFGRKQVLQPVPLSLNSVAAGMENMLNRLIGEDITLVQRLDPALGVTMADPGQIEQVIMNLVVNSKDAMPNGGRLSIETANFEFHEDQVAGLRAGPYVMLSVTDTGCGMDAETKAHVFEPFFTTKEVGKGTGLGLPTAYGIAKQSGGNISVYSELGVGSTFRVYLPRDVCEVTPAMAKPACAGSRTGSETIMVVEDEAGVRNSASRILGACGYTVLTAENGLDALEQCDAHGGDIDLVLTDVVMPKMSGAAFAVELARLRPLTRILFMSGYSGDAIVHKGILDPGTQFIGKPFNAGDLTRKVREMLDSDRDAYPTDPTDLAPVGKEAS